MLTHEPAATTTRCGVVGSPVAHSLSPVMHRAAYDVLGLDWSYDVTEVPEGTLARFIADRGDWRGLSVTAPLKREALALAESADEVASLVGAANTLVRDGDRVVASNTDVPGAVAALREAGIDTVGLVRVLGGGATAASMAHAVARLGARRVEFVVREPARAAEAADAAGRAGLDAVVHVIDDPMVDVADLLISTVPGGTFNGRSHEFAESARAVFDVAYDPWPSPLVDAAHSEHRPGLTGIDLLAHQAVLQVELMTGRSVPVDVVRRAALARLG